MITIMTLIHNGCDFAHSKPLFLQIESVVFVEERQWTMDMFRCARIYNV